MPRISQNNKLLQVDDNVLGKDSLIAQAFSGDEAVNELFRFTLDVISPLHEITPSQLLNKPLPVSVVGHDENKRWFHGIVSHFAQYGRTRGYDTGDQYYRYRIEIVPKMWLLTQRTECRIFQKQHTKDIVTSVLAEYGITPKSMPATPGREWETCVQYLESDFAFVSRLMEEEGWFYFHTHSASAHDLYITNDTSRYTAVAGGDVYMGHRGDQSHVIESWELEQRILPSEWETRDYSYLQVKDSSNTTQSLLPKTAGQLTVFDFPGGHTDSGLESDLARNRMEAIEVGGKVATGHGYCWWFAAGTTFKLQDHYNDQEAGKEWVCARVHHIVNDATELDGKSDSPMYSNSFTCMDKETKLKPSRKTPRPVIAGTQTARVTVAEASMDPDGHGRVKVEFHWVAGSRGRGPGNSCWVRVAQPFAGPKFGFQYIPQVDDEVIVSFIDGDPDFPIIIGSVHNGKNKYPWDVPANWTQSGFRTRASGAGKYSGEASNVLRFEDKSGSEEIWIHAAKDHRREVENDDKLDVGNDQTQDVKMNRKRKVGMDEKVEIGLTQHVKAGTKITLECGQSKITMDPTSIKIESMMITVKASLTLDEEGLMTTVKGNAMLTLKGGIIFIN
jgi:type VI secretion system secreted protein VgrG